MTSLEPLHGHDAFYAVMGSKRGSNAPVPATMNEMCASVTVLVRFDKDSGRYVASVADDARKLGKLEKEGVTPGEAATHVWGTAIAQLKKQLDDA